ncbi:hypothetical protein ABZ319_15870 [Nocardia sp. NPDC005978]|uniref:hypothetical protein n=1 Tax=Nocardia sp. NPDC005978 TaxID=3156725 RepID=UPI0033B5AB31
MTATCPACSWPAPALVSAHGSVRYLRCVCGKWLIEEHDAVLATAGRSTLTEPESDGAPARSTIRATTQPTTITATDPGRGSASGSGGRTVAER